MAAGGCAEDRESVPHREHFNIVFTVPKRILLFVSISMGLYCLVCCLANTASMAQTTPEDICRHPPSGCNTGAEAASSPLPSSPAPAILPALGDEPVTPDFAAFCQKLGYQVNPDFVSFIATPLTLPCMTPPPVQADPIALAPGQDPLLAGSGANLTPIAEPPGAYVLPSNLCGIPDASAGLQAALNAAAGGTLWIPAGCIVNTYTPSRIWSNTTIACGAGATLHNATLPSPSVAGTINTLEEFDQTNITIEGCTFTGTGGGQWDNSMEGGDLVDFYGGSNFTVTDNAFENAWGNGALEFNAANGVSVTHNYFADNALQGLQFGVTQNYTVSYNTSIDSGFDVEDPAPEPAGSSSGTWSNNTFECQNGQAYYTKAFPGYGLCFWSTGVGCSSNPTTQPCSPGQYRNVVTTNNTCSGPGIFMDVSASTGGTVTNNTNCPISTQP
jgi:Right handed beta helix region